MTEANELRQLILADVDRIQQVQVLLMNAINIIDEVRQNVLLYSLTNDNMYTRSAARSMAEAGHEIHVDTEVLLSVQSELVQWSRLL